MSGFFTNLLTPCPPLWHILSVYTHTPESERKPLHPTLTNLIRTHFLKWSVPQVVKFMENVKRRVERWQSPRYFNSNFFRRHSQSTYALWKCILHVLGIEWPLICTAHWIFSVIAFNSFKLMRHQAFCSRDGWIVPTVLNDMFATSVDHGKD